MGSGFILRSRIIVIFDSLEKNELFAKKSYRSTARCAHSLDLDSSNEQKASGEKYLHKIETKTSKSGAGLRRIGESIRDYGAKRAMISELITEDWK